MALTPPRADSPGDPDRDPLLGRVYAESARDEPPARLDDAIRAAARREVHARPRSLNTVLRAWRTPVSLAAILVLSVSVVMLMKEEGADQLYPEPAAEREVSRAPVPAGALEPQEAPEKVAGASAPASPATAKLEADSLKRDRRDSAAPEHMQRQVESVLARAEPSAIPPTAPAEAHPAAPPASQPFPARESAGNAAAHSPPPDRGMRRQSADTVLQEARPAQQDDAVPRGAAPAASGSQAAAAPDPAAPAAKARAAARQELGAIAPTAPAPVWAGYERLPPEKWVARIEELRRAGREAEARDMLLELRKRYPEHPLPPGLTPSR